MQITEIPMICPHCGWRGKAIDCDCDADHPKYEDDGRLRCPKCIYEVKEDSPADKS